MKTNNDNVLPLSERIYRLKLLQGFTILTRDEAGRDGDWSLEERQRMVEDLILLNREMPYPASPEEFEQLPINLAALLGKCQSQWSREVEPRLLLMVAVGSYVASQDPGAVVLEGLMPLI